MSSGRFIVAATMTITLGFSYLATAQSIQDQADAVEFEYTGDNGPGFWGSLSDDWRACDGSRQSPVNLERAVRDTGLGPLRLDLRDTQIALTNNGHTIQQDYDRGSTLILDGAVFDLLQFHFHSLSEHTVNGQHYPMELHAVFRNSVTGNLAVVGQLFRIGGENTFLSHFPRLPRKKGETSRASRQVNVAGAFASTESYATYHGSLTTPPCSEIVTWIVLTTPAEMSAAQFQEFRLVMGNNFRPVQDRGPSFFVRIREP